MSATCLNDSTHIAARAGERKSTGSGQRGEHEKRAVPSRSSSDELLGCHGAGAVRILAVAANGGGGLHGALALRLDASARLGHRRKASEPRGQLRAVPCRPVARARACGRRLVHDIVRREAVLAAIHEVRDERGVLR